ncbi:hypothetical protein RHMOL_Rhmol04G0087300 [Rhododendron molle]|uniref:Uncharacterized protein n=1 Tax=Rhododendron molle TaxID=49168 RepID=A0ACC0NZN9_RHOML|nr:hypothetical protein RHMOL_Rhmol04G0087300 [Rhododendron molle]
MVVNPIRQMSEDNQQLIWFKDKVAKEQRRSKALEESLGVLSEKVRKKDEENCIIRHRSKMHHLQNKEEFLAASGTSPGGPMYGIVVEYDASCFALSMKRVAGLWEEDFAKFVKSQDKEMEEFVSEREKLVKAYEDNKKSMTERHFEEESTPVGGRRQKQ